MFYTEGLRRYLAILVLCCALPSLAAVENRYQKGKIIDIEQKVNTRVLYYQVNTPITQDDPYYEVTIQVEDTTYVGEYTPRHAKDVLPEDMTVSSEVQVRIDKRHMLVKRSSEKDLDLVITKRSGAKPSAK